MKLILATLFLIGLGRGAYAQGSRVELDAEEMLSLRGDPVTAPVVFRLRTADSSPLDAIMSPLEGADVAVWEIQIYDFYGKKVAFIQGRAAPPPSVIPWSGSSEEGLRLPDGYYQARFSWLDSRLGVHPGPFIAVSLLTQPRVPVLREG